MVIQINLTDMNMKFLISFATIFILAAFQLVSAELLELRNAVEKGMEYNFSVRIAKQRYEISDKNVNFGNAGGMPRLDLSGGATFKTNDIDLTFAEGSSIKKDGNSDKNYSYGAQLSWTLFDGMAMFARMDQFDLIRSRSQIEVQAAMEGMIRELTTAYYDAVRLKQDLKTLQESIEINMDRLQRIENKIQFGSSMKLELLRAKVDLNADSSKYLETETSLLNAKRRINYIIGERIDTEYEFQNDVDFPALPEFDELKNNAMAYNTSINTALKNKQISEADKRVIISSYYPRLAANGAYNFNRNDADAGFILKNQSAGFSVGLTASWNIFNGFQDDIRRQNAEMNIMINDIQIEQLKSQIELTIYNAWELYTRRMQILRMEEQNLETSEQNFTRSRELYDLGQVTSVDLRNAQLSLQRSRNAINTAKFLAKVAETELLIISGKILNK